MDETAPIAQTECSVDARIAVTQGHEEGNCMRWKIGLLYERACFPPLEEDDFVEAWKNLVIARNALRKQTASEATRTYVSWVRLIFARGV